MKRRPAETDPVTYTTGQVSRILGSGLTAQQLIRLDDNRLFAPSYYFDADAAGRVVPRQNLTSAELEAIDGSRRRYSYQDLIWITLLRYVKNRLMESEVPSPTRRAAEVLQEIQRLFGDRCPSSSRIIFVGPNAYLLTDEARLTCLTDPAGGQVALTALLLETVDAEVRGRVAVLADLNEVPALAVAGG